MCLDLNQTDCSGFAGEISTLSVWTIPSVRSASYHAHEIGKNPQTNGVALFWVRLNAPGVFIADNAGIHYTVVCIGEHCSRVKRLAIIAVGKIGVGPVW